MMKITWPNYCRAESAATAYRTALDLLRRKPIADVLHTLEEKLREKELVTAAWREQREQNQVEKADQEYREQAAEMDEMNDE